MFTIRNFTGGTLDEMLSPPLRVVDYGNDRAVITVSTRLRQCWRLRPDWPEGEGFSDTNGGISKMIHSIQDASKDALESGRNPDNDTIHTPLRDATYHTWNHVFWDVSKFLAEVNCNTGTFTPPAHEVVVLNYPTNGQTWDESMYAHAQTMEVGDQAMLISPIFVDVGLKLRLTTGTEVKCPSSEEELQSTAHFAVDATTEEKFDEEFKICWVKSGEVVQMYIGGHCDGSRKGVAAVFVCGKYTRDTESELACDHSL